MSADAEDLPLASEFPAATRETWLKLVDGVLKGAPRERLVAKTADGLSVEPLYPRTTDATIVAGRPAATPWQIMQRLDHPDPAEANKQALTDLENGATGLSLVFAGANGSAGFGLDPSPAAIRRTLDGVHLDAGIGIEFQIGPQSREAPFHVLALLKEQGIAASACDIRFGFDPIGAAAVWGASPYSWDDMAPTLADAVNAVAAQGVQGRAVVADGRVVHDAGGSEAQELAFVLAAGIAYLRALEASGMPLSTARNMIYARMRADADQFLTMAKFRSLRKLWARVEQACGLTPAPLFIAADTAWRMLTRRDTDVNMLRATMATFAAGLAGANSITVLPHTLALGLPDAFARRVARNTQLILLEESNLDKVTDPAAGSGGIEALTAQLSTHAWELFQNIEKAGGIWAALASNMLQGQISDVRTLREKNVARRKDVITGTSEFANLLEKSPSVLPARPVALEAYGDAKYTFDALTPYRLAEPFEALRDVSDEILARTGSRPKVFLANLGTPESFTTRATFAKNFFEAGGIEAPDNDGFWEIPTLVHHFKKAGTSLVCLCSSDAVYATNAADAAKALAEAGAAPIYLAGRPGEKEADYRAAAVSDFIFAGSDVLATLRAAYQEAKQ
ncbi:methylmalonyl-CoA mutase subunit beta [Bradyrhizobium sp. LHD-71]|uniref:methylmalonyl-CoA mutase subunit beta n=1 Tax=Bradyrhizobium sp. LHD-71 TaxID=3072141 RepID=UPI00280E8FA1|nr:methylmalonyl-CoA mutase subunit beta [Bradyrhizobium sp. LHD-71]MDQ8728547.1 methylmalonyl-CoA mutase subunit beta [Bradyrhizobium sp. LHD-71]